ncbi:MAG: hypothetical protein V1897_12420 [Pseudomonadota bacterium]
MTSDVRFTLLLIGFHRVPVLKVLGSVLATQIFPECAGFDYKFDFGYGFYPFSEKLISNYYCQGAAKGLDD